MEKDEEPHDGYPPQPVKSTKSESGVPAKYLDQNNSQVE